MNSKVIRYFLVGLSEFGNRLAKKYSLGMKQRLGLASALLGEPPVLILDEPTNGLDPAGIHEIRTLIKSLPKRYDCTVLISSHMLSEIELLADDIGILNHGKLLFEGMVPAISCMWAITILFEKPLLSMGLNLFLIIPGVLVANTPLWLVYPYCYSGYVVSDALHTVTTAGIGSTISLFPFIPCAVIISALALCVSIKCFGRKEMR